MMTCRMNLKEIKQIMFHFKKIFDILYSKKNVNFKLNLQFQRKLKSKTWKISNQKLMIKRKKTQTKEKKEASTQSKI